jgi:phosphate transport system permease protein
MGKKLQNQILLPTLILWAIAIFVTAVFCWFLWVILWDCGGQN